MVIQKSSTQFYVQYTTKGEKHHDNEDDNAGYQACRPTAAVQPHEYSNKSLLADSFQPSE